MPSAGIEPTLREPQSRVLSIELRGQKRGLRVYVFFAKGRLHLGSPETKLHKTYISCVCMKSQKNPSKQKYP